MVDVCVRLRGSMMVMTSTLVEATTLVSAVPVYDVTVAVTVRIFVVVESDESRARRLLRSAPARQIGRAGEALTPLMAAEDI